MVSTYIGSSKFNKNMTFDSISRGAFKIHNYRIVNIRTAFRCWSCRLARRLLSTLKTRTYVRRMRGFVQRRKIDRYVYCTVTATNALLMS